MRMCERAWLLFERPRDNVQHSKPACIREEPPCTSPGCSPRRPPAMPRREFLHRAGGGFGMLALAGLLQQEAAGQDGAGRIRWRRQAGHFPAKAKSVIWLFMNGGPSQVDTWDYKPELAQRDGQELTGFDQQHRLLHRAGRAADEVAVPVSPARPVAAPGSRRSFPNMAQHVDKMAFIHSCWTDSNNHSPALFKINTGMTPHGLSLRRLVGDLRPGQREPEPAGLRRDVRHARPRACPRAMRRTGAPASCRASIQGTALKPQGAPIDNLYRAGRHDRPPAAGPARSAAPGSIAGSSSSVRAKPSWPPASRRSSWPTACRWPPPRRSTSTARPQPTQQLYGLDNPQVHALRQAVPDRPAAGRARRALRADLLAAARRTSGAGTATPTSPTTTRGFAGETDQPIAGLLTDLKQRGLLDSTLVIWGGEFGRLPIVQSGGTGRDHNPHAFTIWLAGGGVKGGVQSRRDRRDRPRGRRGSRQRQRPARHDPAPARASTTSG